MKSSGSSPLELGSEQFHKVFREQRSFEEHSASIIWGETLDFWEKYEQIRAFTYILETHERRSDRRSLVRESHLMIS